MGPMPSSQTLVDNYARQLSAEKGINMEKVGANPYNDLGWGLLDLFIYGLTFGCVDLRSGDFASAQNNLQIMNKAAYAQLPTDNEDKTTGRKVIFDIGNERQLMSIKRARQGLETGLKISIGGASAFVPGMDFDGLKEKLECQTTVHAFSKVVKGGLDKPKELIQGLAETRTITGQPVVSRKEIRDGKEGNYVVPTITRRDIPGMPGVSVHIGNNYIAGPNKLGFVDDGATVAYVGDMGVMTVVDGYGSKAKHACSQVHSALISTAALVTVAQYRDGYINSTDLQANFVANMKLLYPQSGMPQGDTGVSFAGGVTYLGHDGKLKLFSFGLSAALFVSVAGDGSVAHYHVQKEADKGKPFVSSGRFIDLTNLCQVGLHDVSDNTTAFKLGSDGCFSEYCEDVPADYDQTRQVLDLQCRNLPVHGEISPHFTDEERLLKAFNLSSTQLEAASERRKAALILPGLIAWEVNLTAPRSAVNQQSNDFWDELENLDEDVLPGSLKMPDVETVNLVQEQLAILEKFEKAKINSATKISEFIQVDKDKKSLQLTKAAEDNPTAQLLLTICLLALEKNPSFMDTAQIEGGKVIVERMTNLAKNTLDKLIKPWKALIQEPDGSDTEWRSLSTEQGRQTYQKNFGKPDSATVQAWREEWEAATIEYNKLSINHKELAGDDFIFVSVEKKGMVEELTKRAKNTLTN